MAVRKLTASSIENNIWYKSMLAGNAAYNPSAYDLLTSTILTSTAATISFSSLGSYSDYKHLQIRFVARSDTTTSGNISMRINGDTGSNYAYHWVRGSGSAVGSFSATSQTVMRAGLIIPSDGVANNFAPSIIDILDFSNSSKNTTIRVFYGLHDGVGASNEIGLNSAFWNNTAAVTSLTLTPPGGNFAIGSRFSLYGIK